MAEKVVYYWECDNCRIKKQVEFKGWNTGDEARREVLREGWLKFKVEGELMSKTGILGGIYRLGWSARLNAVSIRFAAILSPGGLINGL